jgi:Methylase involved in ubiquinone/menaquinone biosynthesis
MLGRNYILSIVSNLINGFTKEPRVLAIGCGFGYITAHILNTNPNSIIFVIDYSDEMLELCKERFKENKNIKINKQDLNNRLPKFDINEKFDVVVSSIVLHHVEFENRAKLYTDEKLGDKPGTLWEMRDDLLMAGFRNIDCAWKYQNLAIMAAF